MMLDHPRHPRKNALWSTVVILCDIPRDSQLHTALRMHAHRRDNEMGTY
ncbi:hypothetical protein HC928_16615 [bacterium]|nr:hypothetical protein [bacterium]